MEESMADLRTPELSTGLAGDGPLLTQAQLSAERLALRVTQAPAVEAAKAQLRSELLDQPVGRTRDGALRLDQAIDHWARTLALRLARSDLFDPHFIWSVDETPRHTHGYDWPGAGIGGLGNPDNVYRTAFLDGDGSYEVIGQRGINGSAHFSLELTRQEPGRLQLQPVKGNEADLGDQVGILTVNDVEIGPDGIFRVTIGPDRESDGHSHIRSTSGTLALNHRDTLSNWDQLPNALSIRRLGGAGAPSILDERDLVEQTASGLREFVAFWGVFRDYFMGAPAPNLVAGPVVRDGGWGLAAGGRFQLEEDQVLLVTTTATDAIYTGFQVGDPWMMVGSSRDTQNGLNGAQIEPDRDGLITYAISEQDPGLANWLDTGGVRAGWFMIRWQWLGIAGERPGLVHSASLVERSHVQAAVPNAVRLSPRERARQLASRRASYDHRLARR
jgi:hypothetical protein